MNSIDDHQHAAIYKRTTPAIMIVQLPLAQQVKVRRRAHVSLKAGVWWAKAFECLVMDCFVLRVPEKGRIIVDWAFRIYMF